MIMCNPITSSQARVLTNQRIFALAHGYTNSKQVCQHTHAMVTVIKEESSKIDVLKYILNSNQV